MSEEIDKHVLKKYEVQQRLGKGVSARPGRGPAAAAAAAAGDNRGSDSAPRAATGPARLRHQFATPSVASPLGPRLAPTGLPLPPTQAYGIVWKAIDKKTKETVALKKIFDAFQNATDAQVRRRPVGMARNARAAAPRGSPLGVCGSAARAQARLPAPFAVQRTFREIMFLQEMNNHENIIRCGRARAVVLVGSVRQLPWWTCGPLRAAGLMAL